MNSIYSISFLSSLNLSPSLGTTSFQAFSIISHQLFFQQARTFGKINENSWAAEDAKKMGVSVDPPPDIDITKSTYVDMDYLKNTPQDVAELGDKILALDQIKFAQLGMYLRVRQICKWLQ